MKEIYGYNFDDFIYLMEPFVEDGAIKKIYIEKKEVEDIQENRFKPRYIINVVLGDVSEYANYSDVKTGDITIEENFISMLQELLLLSSDIRLCEFVYTYDETLNKLWEVIV